MTGALAHVARVCVGSRNAAKIEAARLAVRAYAPAASVCGSDVGSGVAEQPVGLEEIRRGAANRARAARAVDGACLGVGIEDGLVRLDDALVLNVGCAVVTDGGREGVGLSSAFAYPPEACGPAFEQGEPVGELFDALWRAGKGEALAAPSGRGEGNIGLLSGGVLPRSEYGRHAVLCALLPFLHPDWYAACASPSAPVEARP